MYPETTLSLESHYHLEFFTMLILAGIGTRLPLVKIPLRWLEVYFHEISHGIAVLLTFGRPVRLKLTWRGEGSISSRGGWSLPVLFAGYAGASLWGLTIYLAGVYLGQGEALTILSTLLILVIISTLLLVRDIMTFIIMTSLGLLFFLPLQYSNTPYLPDALRFIGMGVGFNALKAPLDLIDGKHIGDGAELANKTLIPEGVWILAWFGLGVMSILYMWQTPLPMEERLFSFMPFLS